MQLALTTKGARRRERRKGASMQRARRKFTPAAAAAAAAPPEVHGVRRAGRAGRFTALGEFLGVHKKGRWQNREPSRTSAGAC